MSVGFRTRRIGLSGGNLDGQRRRSESGEVGLRHFKLALGDVEVSLRRRDLFGTRAVLHALEVGLRRRQRGFQVGVLQLDERLAGLDLVAFGHEHLRHTSAGAERKIGVTDGRDIALRRCAGGARLFWRVAVGVGVGLAPDWRSRRASARRTMPMISFFM